MRKLTMIVTELKREINTEFPDWNNISCLAEEASFVEDNQDGGYEGMKVEVDILQRIFSISHGKAYVNGHTLNGEIFFVFVPENERRKGMAKTLLRRAIALLRGEYGLHTTIASPTFKEGIGLVEWFKKEVING